ncbi:histidine kinase dimerization/phospho-acceptor domain-containing protein [Pedobacter metabolipauper]|uniref:histidine kinase n=1 Tax=Pedobacter metabolipauper TaxID=425513 RepID=A0A4R6SZ88_9SPHI|nr:histidine kinase dimerization/phospho-acceptor domain-containing protein [Pedobacter metabolipauper]TDQ10014.1 phospho-acceptor domain-containing protein [Pedobacter metabolipauper]
MQNFKEIQKLLNNSSIYYLISVDMDSRYSYLNERYHKAFDGIHGNLVGQHYAVTIHPDDLKICIEAAEKCFKNPAGIYPAVLRKHDGKGGYIITEWEYKGMFNADGSPAGIFCLGHDITELNETKLTLSDLVYQQSHVIRKPIANLVGLTELLENMEIDPSVKEVIARISESATELDQIIRNMAEK